MNTLALFAAAIIAYGLFSRRLERWNISPQMAFVTVGLFFGADAIGLIDFQFDSEPFLFLGEVALVLTLFTDASRIDLSSLRASESLPTRMLAIGMPLTIIAGTGLAALLFTDLTIWEAAIVGTILAPTDAGLGQAVVNSPLVPVRIRQALNVESGLNDGIATPILFLFIALEGAEEELGSAGYWARFALEQIGFGILIGLVIGLTGGWLISFAVRRRWMIKTFHWLAFPSLAIVVWTLSEPFGGNGFIAAFVAGLATAWISHGIEENVVEYSETGGQILNLAVFFIFGSMVLLEFDTFTWSILLYAVLSLTLIRMLPVAISLIGSGLHGSTVLFMGWFGPRGLASIVLGMILLEDSEAVNSADQIIRIMMVTVILSIFAHGISSNPLIKLYRRRTASLEKEASENKEVFQLPTRKIAKPHLQEGG